jgi:cytochrome c5
MTKIPQTLLAAAAFVFALLVTTSCAQAQSADRSGKQVVDAVCASCHAKGAKSAAPKIGDKKAWSKRAEQGLSSLTEHAVKGIRDMPAHGGSSTVTDLEIGRAVTYMVNQSGGKWVEPARAKGKAGERTGEQVVKAQCAQCHQAGKGGAPKIGDANAWKPRLSKGVDALVESAIHGHGGMPPRGDKADLTDSEIRSAILYLYNPKAPPKDAPAVATPAKPSGMHKTVGGVEVYLGFVSAETLRRYPEGSVERVMHGGVPKGSGNYHVNVSLLDRASSAPIKDAKVEIQVEQPGMSASYGAYVKLLPKTQYVVTVRARVPDSPSPVEARFDHKTY